MQSNKIKVGKKIKKILKQAQKIAEKTLNKNFSKLKELNIPKKRGVYLIKNKQGEIFYVGKSSNLFNRIIFGHSSKSNDKRSILRVKLNRKGMPYNRIADFLNQCSFVYQEIENKDVCSLIEVLLIAYARNKGEPLLND